MRKTSKKNGNGKGVTRIEQDALKKVASELHLKVVPQAGFIKIQGPEGRAVYVSKAKKVARVDIYGFESNLKGVKDLGNAAFGHVKQQLDFVGRQPAEILKTFRSLLTYMKSLPPIEHKRGDGAAAAAESPA